MFETKAQAGVARESQGCDLTAVILAGGLGTRLRSMVNDRPKVMAMVAGRPFGEWLVMALQAAGIKHLIFCTGYMGEMVKDHFHDGATWGMTIDYSHEKDLLGTGGAIRQSLSLVRSDPVLVVNGDSYCQVNISEYLQWHTAMPRAGSLVVVRKDIPERFGSVKLSNLDAVVSFKEKALGVGDSWINAGMYLLSQKLLEPIPLNQFISLEKDVLPLWVNQGLWGFPSLGTFVDMGTPPGLCEAEEIFATPVT